MKIECLKDKLSKVLSKVEKMTSKNSTLPVLSCILLKVKDGKLTVIGTNLDLGIEISLAVKVLEEGTVAVPASIITNFISNVYEKNITLETKDNNLLIKTEKNSAVIKTMPSDDFPLIPKIESENKFDINSKDFIKGLKSVYYCASVSSIKPTLSSVLVYPEDDSVVFVATDGFRLAEKKIKTKKVKDFVQVLLPYKNITEIMKVFEDIDADIKISSNENQISLQYEDIYLVSRVVTGNFPDYTNFVPKEFKTEVVLLKQDFINSLKISNIFIDKFSQVYLNIDPKTKKFEVVTKNIDIGENKNEIDAVLKGDSLSMSFNYKYVIECFQSIESDSIGLYFNDISKPVILRGINDKNYYYLVMPMNK